MAITVDWGTKIINVPKADTQLVSAGPPEIRQLDIDAFRLVLKDLEDDPEGMPFIQTHNHNQPVTVGGVTLARVFEIINGYTVTFEDGQYAVNLVGANSNISDVANVNQVSIRSANSAGLTFSDEINNQSFQGSVWINTSLGLPGIQFPRGSLTDPVDNWTDAVVISTSRNILRYHLTGTLAPDTSVDNQVIEGNDPSTATVILAAVTTSNALFKNVAVTGVTTGTASFQDCAIGSIAGFNGYARECIIGGTITLNPANTVTQRFISCHSDVPGITRPTIDCNGADADVSIRDYTGGLTVENFSAAGRSMSIDMNSGTVEIAASCTAGTINVRGMVLLIDNSGVGCTVVSDGTVTELSAAGSITEGDKDDIAARIIPQIWAAAP